MAIAMGTATGGGAQTPRSAGAAAPITFAKDIAPVFQEKCEVCHRAEGMAPMSLVKYTDVRPWVRSIRTKVAGREMPPWSIDKTIGIQEFANDRSLSDAQIQAITSWIDAGAPAGDPADLPAPRRWPGADVWELAAYFKRPPDVVLRSPSYMMPAVSQDQWWQPMADYVFPEDAWVAGTETRPAARSRKVVHHAGTYLYQRDDPDFVKAKTTLLRGGVPADASVVKPSLQKPDVADANELEDPRASSTYFSEWAIGKNGEVYEENQAGQFIKKGARIGWDVHLYASGEETSAELEVAMWFYPKGTLPKYRAFKSLFWGVAGSNTRAGRPLEIPPGQESMHEGYTVLGAPAIVLNFQPHMHLRGKSLAMEVIYPDGRVEMLNYVDKFDFRWMVNYIYTKDSAPVLPRGAIIKVTAWHDNTAANKNNPDPKQFVTFGQRSVDEMAHSNEVIVFITDDDYDKIMAERKAKADAAAARATQQQP
jgi:mono/diheme cytochrome c family protein